MNFKTTRRQVSHCPNCGHELDAATSPNGATPSAGDVTLCISCGMLGVLTNTLAIRRASAEEMAAIKGDAPLRLALERLHHSIVHLAIQDGRLWVPLWGGSN